MQDAKLSRLYDLVAELGTAAVAFSGSVGSGAGAGWGSVDSSVGTLGSVGSTGCSGVICVSASGVGCSGVMVAAGSSAWVLCSVTGAEPGLGTFPRDAGQRGSRGAAHRHGRYN